MTSKSKLPTHFVVFHVIYSLNYTFVVLLFARRLICLLMVRNSSASISTVIHKKLPRDMFFLSSSICPFRKSESQNIFFILLKITVLASARVLLPAKNFFQIQVKTLFKQNIILKSRTCPPLLLCYTTASINSVLEFLEMFLTPCLSLKVYTLQFP